MMLLNVVVGDQHAHEDVGMAPGVGVQLFAIKMSTKTRAWHRAWAWHPSLKWVEYLQHNLEI